MDKSVKYYLAGPMSGYPQFNIPAFDTAAKELRALGYTIVSPAERDTYETRSAALASETGSHSDITFQSETYGDMLARDMKILSDEVGGIIFLSGWTGSRGAKVEAYIGLIMGCAFGVYDPIVQCAFPMKTHIVAEAVANELTDRFAST